MLGRHAVELATMESWQAAVPFVAANGVQVTRVGQAQNWSTDIEAVRALVVTAAATRMGLIQDLLDLSVHALAHYFERRSCMAAESRRQSGRLSFHDLLVFARDVLRDEPGVRRDVRRRYRYLLIDEFQDTDPLQLEIAELIGADAGIWEEGRCFFVGDPKQSIYRFRGADLEAYVAARDEVVGTGLTLLTSNFRSEPAIIDFVNGCFEQLLGEHFGSLHAARPPDTLAPSTDLTVSIVGHQFPPGQKIRRTEQRRIESEDCCRAIERALLTEQWQVWDASAKRVRPALLGDVAILVPRRTGLAELESALDGHGIGYRVESTSLIFKSQEVRDVLALARAIDEPGDHAAVVAALRSPAYSIGDDELVAWAAAGGSLSIELPVEESARIAAPRVAEGLHDLAALRSRLLFVGPVAALSEAVRKRRLMQLAADRPKARESWRRTRFVVDRSRAFMEAGGAGLAEFADWIDDQVVGGMRSAESVVPDADEDVVRIMTVHGAKGLEFPITILCGFGTSDESRLPETIARQPDGRTEVHFTKELRTSGHAALDACSRELDGEEAVRLLYVAATRARDHLVVCGHHIASESSRNGNGGGHGNGSANAKLSLTERLLEAAAELEVPPRRLATVLDQPEGPGEPSREAVPSGCTFSGAHLGETPAKPSNRGGEALEVTTEEDYQRWCKTRAAAIEAATRPASIRATEVAVLAGVAGPVATVDQAAAPEQAAAGEEYGSPEGEEVHRAGRRRGRAGTKVGRAV
ncbi:MAG: UvrD-helicase domain-containing protein, partial [Acidimicrobiales bacterium]